MGKAMFCSLVMVIMVNAATIDAAAPPFVLKSQRLCSQCSGCDVKRCPSSEAYPHMTTFDNSLIAGALQSDYVSINDRGIYAVPDIKGGESKGLNAYYGWQITSASASGFHRFSNYMDKCSKGQSFLVVDNHGQVSLQGLRSLKRPAQADWKAFAPPQNFNHRGFRFYMNRSTRKCLTVFGGGTRKRRVGVAKCEFNGSNPFQLFAFRFLYHKAFCCCGLRNQ